MAFTEAYKRICMYGGRFYHSVPGSTFVVPTYLGDGTLKYFSNVPMYPSSAHASMYDIDACNSYSFNSQGWTFSKELVVDDHFVTGSFVAATRVSATWDSSGTITVRVSLTNSTSEEI